MARHAQHESPSPGRTYEQEPQRPDERVRGQEASAGAARAPDALPGEEHQPAPPGQVYEGDRPHADATAPEPQPSPAAYGAAWGQTPTPVQQPASEPRGARRGALTVVGIVLLVVVVVLVVALVRG